jgi:hypothetical protein
MKLTNGMECNGMEWNMDLFRHLCSFVKNIKI